MIGKRVKQLGVRLKLELVRLWCLERQLKQQYSLLYLFSADCFFIAENHYTF